MLDLTEFDGVSFLIGSRLLTEMGAGGFCIDNNVGTACGISLFLFFSVLFSAGHMN
jgi:hypothetical protein